VLGATFSIAENDSSSRRRSYRTLPIIVVTPFRIARHPLRSFEDFSPVEQRSEIGFVEGFTLDQRGRHTLELLAMGLQQFQIFESRAGSPLQRRSSAWMGSSDSIPRGNLGPEEKCGGAVDARYPPARFIPSRLRGDERDRAT
jgi:hypothetical protein